MVENILKCGAGAAKTYAFVAEVNAETKLDLDRYSDDRLALWLGWPIAVKIELDYAALERLYSFLGAALQELDGAAPEAVLAPEEESEAVRD